MRIAVLGGGNGAFAAAADLAEHGIAPRPPEAKPIRFARRATATQKAG